MSVETFSPLRFPDGEELQVLGDDIGDGEKEFGLHAHRNRHEVMGRMPVGMDPSEFDALPVDEVYMTAEDVADTVQGDAVVDNYRRRNSGLDVPEQFESPSEDSFPVFRSALRRYQQIEKKPRVVRIDTDASYGDFVAESAIRELERRVDELQARLNAHIEDPDAHRHAQPMSRVEVLGAVATISKLKSAKTAKEVTAAMPSVPVDVPPFAEGKVQCWKDGENVVCSMRFQAADGQARTATMAAKPKLDVAEVAGCFSRSGVNPVELLGVLPDLADVACAKRLVKEVAGAALDAHRRLDVFGMEDEPLLLPTEGSSMSAPLAAVMELEQRAYEGDPQAEAELEDIQMAAVTPAGHRTVAPLLTEARRRLENTRTQRALSRHSRLAQNYAHAAGWL